MPRRWLSVRGHKEEQKQDKRAGGHSYDFNFDFNDPSSHLENREGHDTEKLRPTTSAGDRHSSKRKPDLTLLIERPKSTDSVLPRSPVSVTRHDGSRIGLAFGSPHHPPQDFASIAGAMSPTAPQQQTNMFEEPLAFHSARSKKWKLGIFFRSKAGQPKPKPVPVLVQAQPHSPEGNKLGLPIQRNPWRNPKSPLPPRFGFETPPPPLPQGHRPQVAFANIDKAAGAATTALGTAPALEISIPATPLERYSVMFRDINGMKQSSLLLRRDRDLDSVTILGEGRLNRDGLIVPQLQRRVTSPTSATFQEGGMGSAGSGHSRQYSLFPATPPISRTQMQSDSPRSIRGRAATAPSSHESPLRNPTPSTTAVVQPQVQESRGPRSESKGFVTPRPAIDSRASSASDIFFDVKSFRDSSGQDGQFVMTEPPSVEIQLARSKSSARKLQQHGAAANTEHMKNRPNQVQDVPLASATCQIDETIALVESLTSPSTAKNNGVHFRSGSSDSLGSSLSARRAMMALDTPGSNIKKIRRKSSLKSRIEVLNIEVPSPVLEAAEESTPVSAVHPVRSSSNKPPVTSIATSFQPREPSPESMSSAVPGRVVKNARNIPLSKYAPKHTTDELIRSTGLRPVRPVRANTDNIVPYDPRASSPQRPHAPSRSVTVPLPSDIRPTRPIAPHSHSLSTNRKHKLPTAVAYVNPVAEVSVARTISLSRKPSTKVTVARSQVSADARKESEKVTEKKVSLSTPVIQEVHRRHKPGLSMDVVLETVNINDSDRPPPMPRPAIFDFGIRSH